MRHLCVALAIVLSSGGNNAAEVTDELAGDENLDRQGARAWEGRDEGFNTHSCDEKWAKPVFPIIELALYFVSGNQACGVTAPYSNHPEGDPESSRPDPA